MRQCTFTSYFPLPFYQNCKDSTSKRRLVYLPFCASEFLVWTSMPRGGTQQMFIWGGRLRPEVQPLTRLKGAKKINFTSTSTSPKVIFTSPKKIFRGPQEFIRNLHVKHLSYSTFVILILRKIFACPSGKLSTEFTSPIAKSTSPGLSDTAFFARCRRFIYNSFTKKVTLSYTFY